MKINTVFKLSSLVLSAMLSLNLASCAGMKNPLSNTPSLSNKTSIPMGRAVLKLDLLGKKQNFNSKALFSSANIQQVRIEVTGYDITSTVIKNVDWTPSSNQFLYIDIPAGKNRLISITGLNSIGVPVARLMAVSDIFQGTLNSITFDAGTTAAGRIVNHILSTTNKAVLANMDLDKLNRQLYFITGYKPAPSNTYFGVDPLKIDVFTISDKIITNNGLINPDDTTDLKTSLNQGSLKVYVKDANGNPITGALIQQALAVNDITEASPVANGSFFTMNVDQGIWDLTAKIYVNSAGTTINFPLNTDEEKNLILNGGGILYAKQQVVVKGTQQQDVTLTLSNLKVKEVQMYNKEKQITSFETPINNTVDLDARVIYEDGSYSRDQVTWDVSDKTVFTITPDGKITGLKKGSGTLTAKSILDKDKSYSLSVNFVDPGATPTITSFVDNGNGTMTIFGKNYDDMVPLNNIVRINGYKADVLEVTTDYIKVTLPNLVGVLSQVGTGYVTVQTASGTVTSDSLYIGAAVASGVLQAAIGANSFIMGSPNTFQINSVNNLLTELTNEAAINKLLQNPASIYSAVVSTDVTTRDVKTLLDSQIKSISDYTGVDYTTLKTDISNASTGTTLSQILAGNNLGGVITVSSKVLASSNTNTVTVSTANTGLNSGDTINISGQSFTIASGGVVPNTTANTTALTFTSNIGFDINKGDLVSPATTSNFYQYFTKYHKQETKLQNALSNNKSVDSAFNSTSTIVGLADDLANKLATFVGFSGSDFIADIKTIKTTNATSTQTIAQFFDNTPLTSSTIPANTNLSSSLQLSDPDLKYHKQENRIALFLLKPSIVDPVLLPSTLLTNLQASQITVIANFINMPLSQFNLEVSYAPSGTTLAQFLNMAKFHKTDSAGLTTSTTLQAVNASGSLPSFISQNTGIALNVLQTVLPLPTQTNTLFNTLQTMGTYSQVQTSTTTVTTAATVGSNSLVLASTSNIYVGKPIKVNGQTLIVTNINQGTNTVSFLPALVNPSAINDLVSITTQAGVSSLTLNTTAGLFLGKSIRINNQNLTVTGISGNTINFTPSIINDVNNNDYVYLNYGPSEGPMVKIALSAYNIDKNEVTNADFKKFMDADGYNKREYWTNDGWNWKVANTITQPLYWNDSKFNQDNQPVVGVSWYEAYAYSKWASKRLPTEAEWEYSAKGAPSVASPWNNQLYPWGNIAPNGGNLFANGFFGSEGDTDGYRYSANKASLTNGNTAAGVSDLSGNVMEWCNDWYQYDYYGRSNDFSNPMGPSAGQFKVVRGGSWTHSGDELRSANREIFLRPESRNSNLGFRCAQ